MQGELQLLERFRDRKICVIGDIIADVYIYGMPYKLSREAPVVVIKWEEERTCPGSAGNTINNLLALGAQVFPVGYVGEDEAGGRLLEYFASHANCALDGIVRHHGRTVTKTRILAGDTHTSKQQVIRVDKENDRDLTATVRSELMQRLDAVAGLVDGFVLSDYEYGLIDDAVIDFVRQAAKELVVVGDSRQNLRKFQGFTLITPNESEAYALSGLDGRRDIEEVGRTILSFMDVGALLVTRGNKGMNLFLRDGGIHHIPISGSDEAADVTGAGDTVAATVALALASGADFYTASNIANHAAGIVVMKSGTAVVTLDELKKVIEDHGPIHT